MRHKGFTVLELLCVLALIAVLAMLLLAGLPMLARRGSAAKTAQCQNNLRQWGLIYAAYAQENGGKLPPMESDPRLSLAPSMKAVYPEYLSDPTILACPEDAQAPLPDRMKTKTAWQASELTQFAGDSYVYFGWVLDRTGDADDTEMLGVCAPAFAKLVYETGGQAATSVGDSVPVQVAQTIEHLIEQHKLGKGAEACAKDIEVGTPHGNGGTSIVAKFTTSASESLQAKTPVMFDAFAVTAGGSVAMFNHVPGGSNVLFLDGHVEFARFPTEPPVSECMGALLGAAHSAFGQLQGPAEAGESVDEL